MLCPPSVSCISSGKIRPLSRTPLRVRAALEADEEHSAVVFGVPHRDGLVQQLAQQSRLARRAALAPPCAERVLGERRHRSGVAQLRGELRAARVQLRQPLVHEVDRTLPVEDLPRAAARSEGLWQAKGAGEARARMPRSVCVRGEVARVREYSSGEEVSE